MRQKAARQQGKTKLLVLDEAEIKARAHDAQPDDARVAGAKAAGYMQLEERIRAVQDCDIAATVPLTR